MTDHAAQSHVKVSFETLGMVVAVGLPLVFNGRRIRGVHPLAVALLLGWYR